MAYMIYQQLTTAVKEAYAGDEELSDLHAQAQVCRWLLTEEGQCSGNGKCRILVLDRICLNAFAEFFSINRYCQGQVHIFR